MRSRNLGQRPETPGTWSEAHDRLQRVLNQLEDLDAQVVTFRVDQLSEIEAEGWYRSESLRLGRLVQATGDKYA